MPPTSQGCLPMVVGRWAGEDVVGVTGGLGGWMLEEGGLICDVWVVGTSRWM